jgi:hypothetical protein
MTELARYANAQVALPHTNDGLQRIHIDVTADGLTLLWLPGSDAPTIIPAGRGVDVDCIIDRVWLTPRGS